MKFLDRTVDHHYSFNFRTLVSACVDTCLFLSSKAFALRLRVMLTPFSLKIEADKFDKGTLNTVVLALCGSKRGKGIALEKSSFQAPTVAN